MNATQTRIPMRQEFHAAQKTLRADGWEHVLSAMHADGDFKFGLLYAKGVKRFWLNLLTIDTLPGSLRTRGGVTVQVTGQQESACGTAFVTFKAVWAERDGRVVAYGDGGEQAVTLDEFKAEYKANAAA